MRPFREYRHAAPANELVRFDRNEPMISLCGECLHLLKYADASSWKWFREYRERLIHTKQRASEI